MAIPIRLGAAVSAAAGLACREGAEPPLTTSGAFSDLADLPVAAEAEVFVEADGCADVLSTASGIFWVSSAAAGAAVCTFDDVVAAAAVDAGFGAELSALVQENCFYHLEAPIVRVTGWDTPYPHAQEWDYFPGPARVGRALKAVMEA